MLLNMHSYSRDSSKGMKDLANIRVNNVSLNANRGNNSVYVLMSTLSCKTIEYNYYANLALIKIQKVVLWSVAYLEMNSG